MNIVKILKYVETINEYKNKEIFISMPKYENNLTSEFLDNVNCLNSAQLFEKINKLAYQTVKALAYTHSQKIVHNDLSPDNIMVDTNNNAVIIDFGLAQDYNSAPYVKAKE